MWKVYRVLILIYLKVVSEVRACKDAFRGVSLLLKAERGVIPNMSYTRPSVFIGWKSFF
jgi:hypothetical protein